MICYENYINDYNGTIVNNESEFMRLSDIALRYINSVTISNCPQKNVEEAVYVICDILSERKDSFGIKSEKNGEVNVTYTDYGLQKLMFNALRLYIPSEYLYRGI